MPTVRRAWVDETQSQVEDLVRKAEMSLASDVLRIRYSLGWDWSGDPSVYFRVVLSNAASKGERLGEVSQAVIRMISDDLYEVGVDLQPYFSFRSESETKAAPEEGWI